MCQELNALELLFGIILGSYQRTIGATENTTPRYNTRTLTIGSLSKSPVVNSFDLEQQIWFLGKFDFGPGPVSDCSRLILSVLAVAEVESELSFYDLVIQ